MRDRAEIAERLLAARATVRELSELEQHGAGGPSAHPAPHPAKAGAKATAASALQSTRLLAYRAYVEALAWTLDIDLNQIDIPMTLLSGLAEEELPTTVQLHRLELGEPPRPLVMWLAEIPAHHDERGTDYSTESWSCFLHDEQAHQLLAALTTALTPPASALVQRPLQLPLLGRAGALRGISQSAVHPTPNPPVSPAPPDVAGGYADYAGVAAFADDDDQDDDDQDDDEQDDDEQDDPPAGALAPAAPKGA